MEVIELVIKNQTYIIPSNPVAPIMIYQRYGYYFIEFEGWAFNESQQQQSTKKYYDLDVSSADGPITITVKTWSDISRLKMNEVVRAGTHRLEDKDFNQMVKKYNTLGSLLKVEGLI